MKQIGERGEMVNKLKIVLAGAAIVTAACGHSDSYNTGYWSGSHNPAWVRKMIGKDSPEDLCQNALTVAKMSSDTHNVDPSDFIKGCLDGVQQALKD